MARVFCSTAAATSLRVDGQGRAEASFTVSNTSGRPLRGRAEVRTTDPAQQTWFSIAGEAERNFAAGGTDQVSVKVAVKPGAPAGKYSFRLDVVSVQNPDEDFAEGPTVTLEVVAVAPNKKAFPWWIIPAAAAVLVIAGVAVYFFTRGKIEVPDVEGVTAAEAVKRIQDAKLKVGKQTTKLAETGASGTVLSQDPRAGERVKEGAEVTFEVVEAAVKVPAVVGKRRDEAEAILKQARLRVGGPFLREATGSTQDNIVQEQKPAVGTLIPVDGPVDLFVTMLLIRGSEVPSVVGSARPVAEANIKAANLSVGRVDPRPSLADPGTVVDQYPKPQPGVVVPQGSAVDLFVAAPPPVPPQLDANVAGRVIAYRGVSLNGAPGNRIKVAPSAEVRISFQFGVTVPPQPNLYCPGCIVQFYFGIDRTKGGFSKCLVSSGMGSGYSTQGTIGNFAFRAPAAKGLYYVTNASTFEFSCREDKAQHNSDPVNTLAIIEVE